MILEGWFGKVLFECGVFVVEVERTTVVVFLEEPVFSFLSFVGQMFGVHSLP